MPPRAVWLALLLVGCSKADSTVSGTVTLDGQPLASGFITFYPVEGTQATVGTEVTDGQYEIKKMPPGTRKVVVAPTPDVRVIEHKKGPATIKLLSSTAPLAVEPPTVEIQRGKQTLDFTLTKAKARTAK